MDIHAFVNMDTATTTARVELGTDPATGNPFGVMIVGVDSPQWAGEKHRQMLEGRARARDENKHPEKKIDMDSEEGQTEFQRRFAANMLGFACTVTVDWFGFTAKGKAAKFDAAMVRKLYESRRSYIDKVMNAAEDSARFLPTPEKA
jgi:hypothetical protein